MKEKFPTVKEALEAENIEKLKPTQPTSEHENLEEKLDATDSQSFEAKDEELPADSSPSFSQEWEEYAKRLEKDFATELDESVQTLNESKQKLKNWLDENKQDEDEKDWGEIVSKVYEEKEQDETSTLSKTAQNLKEIAHKVSQEAKEEWNSVKQKTQTMVEKMGSFFRRGIDEMNDSARELQLSLSPLKTEQPPLPKNPETLSTKDNPQAEPQPTTTSELPTAEQQKPEAAEANEVFHMKPLRAQAFVRYDPEPIEPKHRNSHQPFATDYLTIPLSEELLPKDKAIPMIDNKYASRVRFRPSVKTEQPPEHLNESTTPPSSPPAPTTAIAARKIDESRPKTIIYRSASTLRTNLDTPTLSHRQKTEKLNAAMRENIHTQGFDVQVSGEYTPFRESGIIESFQIDCAPKSNLCPKLPSPPTPHYITIESERFYQTLLNEPTANPSPTEAANEIDEIDALQDELEAAFDAFELNPSVATQVVEPKPTPQAPQTTQPQEFEPAQPAAPTPPNDPRPTTPAPLAAQPAPSAPQQTPPPSPMFFAWQQSAQLYLGSTPNPPTPQTAQSPTPFVLPAISVVPAPAPQTEPQNAAIPMFAAPQSPQSLQSPQNLQPAQPLPSTQPIVQAYPTNPQPAQPIAQPAYPLQHTNQPLPPLQSTAPQPLAFQPPQSLARFMLPPLAFLQSPTSEHFEIDETEIDRKVNNLLGKLRLFKIEGDIVGIHTGPIVTTFEYRPAPHIKVSRILNLSDDLAMALQAKTLRIEAPVPGKDVVGIEIPNSQSETILLRDVLQSEAFVRSLSPLTLALGKDIIGRPFVTDLRRLPHLLIAGTTGSGKSVGINAMILSLLYRNTPRELKLIMIDPKMLEFSVYNDIPHLLTPVITESKKAISALSATVGEMEKRYAAMSAMQAKNIETYNQKVGREAALPYIVVVIDELADLMMTGGKEVEFHIARLAQMARASGIHLIIATQRPSVDVVTGSIKANLPARISFKVGAKVDSKVILDTFGAETLLGKGDMLFNQPDGSGIIRLHAPWSSEDEITRIVEFLKSQGAPEYDEEFLKTNEPSARSSSIEGDDLYEQAKQLILADRKTSISYVQRRLGIGYNKAANIIEELEREGFLSAPDSKGVREIL